MRYADFSRLIQNGAVVTLVISGVTGPILIRIAQDVATILPLNISESELPFSYLFQNACLQNEGHFVRPKLVDMILFGCHGNVPRQIGKRGIDQSSVPKAPSCGEKAAKIGPVYLEIFD